MRRLEIIHLRASGPLPSGLVEEIRRTAKKEEAASLDLYCRIHVENDIAIHLHLNASEPDRRCSDLGLCFATALKEYGMVEHTVWRAATTAEEPNSESKS